MKVRMKVDVSGVHDGKPWPRHGEVADVPDGEGADLCAAGLAEPVAQREPEAEKAVGPRSEKAVPADGDTEKAIGPDPEKRPVATGSAGSPAKKAAPSKVAAKKTAPPAAK